jgi:hypothetical protein
MNRVQFLGTVLVLVGAAGMLFGAVETAVASPVVTFGFLLGPVAFLFFLGYHAATYLGYT